MIAVNDKDCRSWPEIVGMALHAHRDGVAWSTFWPQIAEDVSKLQARCYGSHRPLFDRLLALVVAGDESGVEPPEGFAIEIEANA